MPDKRSKFMRAFANVPENLRDDIIAVVDEKPYTWNTAFLEVRDNTGKGKKILQTLEEMGVL